VYTDGTTQPFTLTLSDWGSTTAAPGTSIVTTTTHWNTPSGPASGTRNVFFAPVPLHGGKTVAYVILPSTGSGAGATTTLHVFAIALGG
jgi:beta-glucosidase